MIRDRLERIKERAYALWERAGGGHGDHESHWIAASAEIDKEDTSPKPSRKRSSKIDQTADKKPAAKRTSLLKTHPRPEAEPKFPAAKASRPPKVTEPASVKSSGAQSVKSKSGKAPTSETQAEVGKSARKRRPPAKAASVASVASDGDGLKAKVVRKPLPGS